MIFSVATIRQSKYIKNPASPEYTFDEALGYSLSVSLAMVASPIDDADAQNS